MTVRTGYVDKYNYFLPIFCFDNACDLKGQHRALFEISTTVLHISEYFLYPCYAWCTVIILEKKKVCGNLIVTFQHK